MKDPARFVKTAAAFFLVLGILILMQLLNLGLSIADIFMRTKNSKQAASFFPGDAYYRRSGRVFCAPGFNRTLRLAFFFFP
jgi:hypothetical protein